jgi:hypothetical protein
MDQLTNRSIATAFGGRPVIHLLLGLAAGGLVAHGLGGGVDGPWTALWVLAGALLCALAVRSIRGREPTGAGIPGTPEANSDLLRAAGEGQVEAVLSQMLQQACALPAVDRAVVFLRDRSDPTCSVAVAARGVPGDFLGTRFQANRGALGAALTSGRPQVVEDFRALAQPIDHPVTADLRATAAVPISSQGRTKGALAVGSRERERRFGSRDLDVLSRLADLGGVALEQAENREQLATMLRSSVEALAAAVEARDHQTGEHSDEVVALALEVGRRQGLSRRQLVELEFAARLHDLGKIGVPDAILHKPGPLDESEWQVMRTHPTVGAELLRQVPGLVMVAEIVGAAHERWDGRGYPDGLCGEDIPIASRIIFACDAYHAMTSHRCYRAALSAEAAERELLANAGTQFDPLAVAALLAEVEHRDHPSPDPGPAAGALAGARA